MITSARRAAAAIIALVCTACHGDSTSPNGGQTADLREAFSHGTCKGVMTGGHVTPVDHQYLLPLDLLAGRTRYNVVAPFNGNIVLIQPRVKAAGDPGAGPNGSVEYRIIFEGSCTYWVYYDLVTQLEPSVLSAGGRDLADNKSVYIRMPVSAGQAIGKIGGQTLDLGTVNADITLPGFVVPSHYIAEPWKVHSMDALDYFDEPIRSQLLALDRRKAAPRGGKIDFDVDGAAVGNWFLVGSNGYGGTGPGGGTYWTGHLSLSYGNIDPALVMISMGFPDGSSRQWVVEGNAPDPATVTAANGTVKYEVKNWSGDSVRTSVNIPIVGVVAVQVLAGRQLRVEYFPGVRAAAVTGFDAAARMYER
jgi:hypothetical protein